MKARKIHPVKLKFCTHLIFLLMSFPCFSQGKVVINEFMPWTSNTCGGPTAEFVELLNFGPGPVNIGCYILTDGDFSITIPANTILQPGEFYVISGQSVIPGPCANIDSTITADLNWNTCNCTSGAIPTTGDGLFTDGGSASEQVVLLSPTLTVVDAVVRTLPVEPSALITTSSVGSQCTQTTFDLDLIAINYETIGESAGRGNSFARKLDGDCGWVKDPQQSANATNNTPSEVSDIDYDFAVTNNASCSSNGTLNVIVNASDYSNIFPISYTLAYDSDNDNIFELTDSYINGSDSTPNTLTINGLIAGNYRITVASALGCGLQTFPFTILVCGSVLPVNLASFSVIKNNTEINYRWSIHNPENLEQLVIEKSTDKLKFIPVDTISAATNSAVTWSAGYFFEENDLRFIYFRMRMIQKNGLETFSPVINISADPPTVGKIWPNPVKDHLFTELNFAQEELIHYFIFNTNNQLVAKGDKAVTRGINLFSIPVQHLIPGTYQLRIEQKQPPIGNIQNLRFIKL